MSASFRRIERRRPSGPAGQEQDKTPAPAASAAASSSSPALLLRAPGTQPWVNGQSLVSSGNRDLDVVLGGGLCLGTLTLLEEDRFSDHALCLARYFVAQGVSAGQRTLVVGAEPREALEASMVEQLPFDLTYKKHAAAAAATALAEGQEAKVSSSSLPTIEEGENDEPDHPPASAAAATTPSADSLNIAWQYRKYLPGGGSDAGSNGSSSRSSSNGGASSSSFSSSSFCHSYDLSRPMQPELLGQSGDQRRPQILTVDATTAADGQYAWVYAALSRAVKELPPRTVLRVLVKSLLDRRGAWDGTAAGQQQALHLLLSLRALAASAPVVVLVSLPAHHLGSAHGRPLFARVADTVLEVDSFAGKRHRTPPEFEAFAGLLYVKALQHPHALAPARGPSNKLGIKRDSRKLHIEPLHLPPEGVRALTEDVERGKRRSSPAAMLCGTGGGGGGGGGGGAAGGRAGAGALDF